MSKELKTRGSQSFPFARLAPIFGAFGVTFFCLDFGTGAPNMAGAALVSRSLYGVFLAIALVALWIAPSQSQNWKVKPSAWWWIDVMVCTYFFVPILQWTIPAPRPPESPIQELLGLSLNGWPSGHMVSVFGLAWVLMVARPRLAWLAFALTVAMGWARIESNAHYPFQVISGAVLGMALGWWTTQQPQGLLMPRLYNAVRGVIAGSKRDISSD